MAIQLTVKNWRSYLPILDVIRDYRREDFHHDLVAGLIVGIITIPQAIAYAFLAGLPPEAGLYACLVPMVIYALLGSSKQMVVGPVAVAALMVAAAVGERATAGSEAYLGITTVLCLQAGLILLLLRASNMGGVVNLLSHPVIAGFINAAAILIIVSQLGPLIGVNSSPGSPLQRLGELAESAGSLNTATAMVGIGSAVIMWLVHRYSVPCLQLLGLSIPDNHAISRLGPLVVCVAAVYAVWLGDLQQRFDVEVIGEVPGGLPGFTLPPFNSCLLYTYPSPRDQRPNLVRRLMQ